MEYAEVPAAGPARRRFESGHAVDSFANPLTNPILAKDPRSSTWARFLFVNNNFPGSQAFQGGNAQVYALQLNVALTDRLTLIADKDGIAEIDPRAGDDSSGLLNIAAGLKYTFWRDVENQRPAAVGFQFEAPTGEESVFQGTGDGHFTVFLADGFKLGDDTHFLSTHGFQFPTDAADNASFFYHSFHVDRRFGKVVPLAELNWWQYVGDGDRLPAAVREGDGLLNLGARGQAWRQLVTAAVGAKYEFSCHFWVGAAYEFRLSDYTGLVNNRINVEAVLRY